MEGADPRPATAIYPSNPSLAITYHITHTIYESLLCPRGASNIITFFSMLTLGIECLAQTNYSASLFNNHHQ
jgi:hypothetical protein